MNRVLWFALGCISILSAGAAAGPWLAHRGGPHGWHGPGFHRGPGTWDEEDVRDAVEWWLRGVDASDDQVEAVTRVATQAAADLRAVHDEHRARHEAFLEALAQPEVDAAKLEGMRAEGVALLDQGSKRVVAALAEIAAQLTPEQREALLQRHERHGPRWVR